jgi:hypothetical protein
MKGTVLLVRTMIQVARGILDMKEMILKPRACSLAGSPSPSFQETLSPPLLLVPSCRGVLSRQAHHRLYRLINRKTPFSYPRWIHPGTICRHSESNNEGLVKVRKTAARARYETAQKSS